MNRKYGWVRRALMGVVCAAGPIWAADSCQAVKDSTGKLQTIAMHLYMTQTIAMNPVRNSESIYTGGANGAIYVMVNGKWIKSPVAQRELKPDPGEADPNVKNSCRYLRDEAVNGEAAEVYMTHAESPDYKTDTTIWISKSRKLPLKSETDMDAGGTKGKSHTSTRYDYANVKPPAGVQ